MNLAMRFCYQLVVFFAFCLTVTVIALSYRKFDSLFGSVSNYLPVSLSPQYETESKLEAKSKIYKVPKKLSDLKFHSSYHVTGFLRLFSSNLNEPIEVWYNKKHHQSRVDYYGGILSHIKDVHAKFCRNCIAVHYIKHH